MKFTCLKVEENGDLTFTVNGRDLQAGDKIWLLTPNQYKSLTSDYTWARELREKIQVHFEDTI